MRTTFPSEFPQKELLKSYSVAVSIYMPTHRTITENDHDVLVYKNLVKDIDKKLKNTHGKKEAEELSKALHALEEDFDLWNESLDGLALFATHDFIAIYRLNHPVAPQAVMGPEFHLIPLMQVLQKHRSVLLLALNIDHFNLYQADPYGIKPLKLPESIPTTLKDMLGEDHTDSYHTHGMYANADNRSTFHGHGGAPAEDELDHLRFFRGVNQALAKYLPATYKAPVLLVALDHLTAEFMKLSTISSLDPHAIEGSFEDFTEAELLEILTQRARAAFDETIIPLIDRYHALKKEDLSAPDSNLLDDALNEGRVDTLLVAAETKHEANRLNTMVHKALSKGTHVVVLDDDKMPDHALAAGLFRY